MPEHVVVTKLMLTDRKLKEPLPIDPTLSHIVLNKLVPKKLKKSS